MAGDDSPAILYEYWNLKYGFIRMAFNLKFYNVNYDRKYPTVLEIDEFLNIGINNEVLQCASKPKTKD